MERETTILQLRPHIDTIKTDVESSLIESFQNKTLRPILKWQHDALITVFDRHTEQSQTNMLASEKRNWIKKILSNDSIIRNILIGIVLGMMTIEELAFFFEHQKECRQRLVNMVVDRLATANN